ncbi:MAG: acyl carrier protein [Candidatus Wildermuthbacteria bacterium]|nr:acyl carrier protein [Candidatus Wildermuthbacteria bacterium]
MSSQIQNAVLQWFVSHASLKEDEIGAMIHENYFEKGWVDSLAFISFVNDMEQEFGIRFSNNEFQERTFATIAGVAKIIEEKLEKK